MGNQKEKEPYVWFLLMVGLVFLIIIIVVIYNWENIQQQL